jgi:hypothetical protein
VSLDLREPTLLLAILAFNPERANNLTYNSRSSSDSDVFVTHGTILIQNEPVFNASLAKKLVAIVALFCISSNLYKEIT